MPSRTEIYLLRLWNILTGITGDTGKAGVALIAPVGGIGITSQGTTITQTPTISAGAYVANDNVGGLLTFANAARLAGGGGVIKDVAIIDDAGQDAELELWLFNQVFTPGADNAAWAPVEAELHNIVNVISTTEGTYFLGGTPSVCSIEIAKRFDCLGTDLFGRLVTRGTPTYVATDDLTVKLLLLQD